jgi:glutathione S-transferase
MRVELQAEIPTPRDAVYGLVSTAEGLRRWLDEAELVAQIGSPFRLRLTGAIAVGRVAAVDPPQHLSLAWDWEVQPLGRPTVVAFDLIGHGRRTHLTLRHVGFEDAAQRDLHEAMWRFWFSRLVAVAQAR